MKFLFLFTIGPVQSFIAQARKTQDLYAGSYILSYLCRKAAQVARDEHQAQILFPNIENISIPNRFIATIESDDDNYLRKLGNTLEDIVKNEFEKIAISGFDKLDLGLSPEFSNQLTSFLDIHWLFYPIGDSSYNKAYEVTEMLLGGIKNARSFKDLSEKGRKCTLTGEHNALFFRRKVPAYQSGAIKVPSKVPLKVIAEGEALSAVAWAKRCAEYYFSNNGNGYEGSFPSTAKISLIEQIPSDNMAEWEKDKLDAQLFYPENINERYLSRNGISKTVQEIKDKRNKILESLKIDGGLTKYYAVMIFDGDDMGQWMSGKFLNSPEKLEQFQNDLSSILSNFAIWCQKYISEKNKTGRTVYAGGDDFLGFVNLSRLFEVLSKVREEFKQQVSNKIMSEYKTDEMTLSAGVAIAHYKMPLSVVIKWARQMEAEAKMSNGKNAFSIAVLKRSGDQKSTCLRWFSKEQKLITVYLMKIVELLNKPDVCSNAFINTLNVEFARLMDDNGNYIGDYNQEIVKSELGRLVRRSALTKNEDTIQTLKNDIEYVFDSSDKLSTFLSALNTIDFITRGVSRD